MRIYSHHPYLGLSLIHIYQLKRNKAKELLNETMEELNLSEQMSINAVSYTHLDVYKRQVSS